MSHTLITVTILAVFLSRPSSLWCEHPKLAHKRHASMNKATHHSRRIATKIGRKKTRPALDLLTTLAPNAAVCPSPLSTRHADSPHSDAEARLWSLSRVPSRFPAARGEKRGGGRHGGRRAGGEEGGGSRGEALSFPFFCAAHPVRPESVRFRRRVSCPGVVLLSAWDGRVFFFDWAQTPHPSQR